MDESKITLKEALERIKTLIAQDKLVQAHKACIEILRFDPDNIKVIKLKNKIEARVKQQNIIALKEDIKTLQPLLEQRKFEELLTHLKQLEPYVNQYPPLKKFILKAQSEYRKDVEGQQGDYFNDKKKEIEKLKKQKKYEEALKIVDRLVRDKIELKKSKALMQELQKQWVNYELTKGSQFLETNKFEDILLWLEKLRQVDKENKKIVKLIQKTKQRELIYKKDQKKDFIFTGTEKMKTLIQLKKFDKAAIAGEEILEIDPTNSKVRRMYLEATQKEIRQMNKKLLKQMKTAHKKMREEYIKNKDHFIRF